MTTTVPTTVPQVAISDIGSTRGLLKEIDRTIKYFNDGDLVTGTVVKADHDETLLDIGYETEGVVLLRELPIKHDVDSDEEVKVSDEIEVLVLQKEDKEGRLLLSKKHAQYECTRGDVEKIKEAGGVVVGTVIGAVKSSLILDIELRSFPPASLVEMCHVRDLAPYIGRQLETKITELDKNRNSMVLPRQVFLEQTQPEVRTTFLSTLRRSQVCIGVVSSIVDFRALVDLGGVDGLVHILELSQKRTDHPSEVVQVGQEVTVGILDVDFDHERASLSLKATQGDPWQTFVHTHRVGQIVPGKVTKLVSFEVFVRIEDSTEGLMHVFELTIRHIGVPERVAETGDETFVEAIDIDLERRRISLPLKQANGGVDAGSNDLDSSLYGIPAEYDAEGSYKCPEGFDPETNEWMEGYEKQHAARESSYAQAQARFEARKEQVAKNLETDKEAAIAVGGAEPTSYSSATEEDATHEGTLVDDATLTALRDRLAEDKQSYPMA